jgi:hypothetical protein
MLHLKADLNPWPHNHRTMFMWVFCISWKLSSITGRFEPLTTQLHDLVIILPAAAYFMMNLVRIFIYFAPAFSPALWQNHVVAIMQDCTLTPASCAYCPARFVECLVGGLVSCPALEMSEWSYGRQLCHFCLPEILSICVLPLVTGQLKHQIYIFRNTEIFKKIVFLKRFFWKINGIFKIN